MARPSSSPSQPTDTAWATSPSAPPTSPKHPQLRTAERLVHLLDSAHLDAVVGFVLPGLGDVLGGVVGLYLVGVAVRLDVSPVVIARMLLILALDMVLGLIPFAGDLADVAFRSHRRNLALIKHSVGRGGAASPSDWAWVAGAALVLMGAVALVGWSVVALWRWAF